MMRGALLLAGLLTLACSDRARSNPLDPLNPVSHGAPTGFHAATNRDTAHLVWQSMDVDGLLGYRIHRGVGNNPLAELDTVQPAVTRFMDTPLQYDTRYAYAVQAITPEGQPAISTPDTVVPGPHNFWLADFNRGSVERVTYDGGHLLGQRQLISPEAVAYLPQEGLLWVADFFDRTVLLLDAGLRELLTIRLPGTPIELAADEGGSAVYVLQMDPDSIYHLGTGGQVLEAFGAPAEVSIGGSLAYNGVTGALWLGQPVTTTQGRVYHRALGAGGDWALAASGPPPRRLAADPINGGCWVATDAGVVKLDPAGGRTTFLPEMQVWDVSVNTANGDCYYVGWIQAEDRWQAGRIHGWPDAKIAVILDNSYTSLVRIQALPGPGQTGFITSQSTTGRILRFDGAGQLMGVLENYSFPLEFALE
ncbi:MAG: hypothetical protein IH971_03360 [Candidatus Marinimicrobia bacterium]|nr:hypothetical protein [Candidatus Neomarinimicrobiota bacterium]